MAKSVWKDGRAFARRVHVHTTTQLGAIYHTHAEDAFQMCLKGYAKPIMDKERRISGITLVRTPGEHQRRSGKPKISVNDYTGQHYVYKERLGEDQFAGLTCYTFDKGKL